METQEATPEVIQKWVKQQGKVTARFPARDHCFVANDEREHFFLHLSESPKLTAIPQLGAVVQFLVSPATENRKNRRAIRAELI